jgi:hypothetical protein
MRIRNPSDIKMRNGRLTDKYGRTFEMDWKNFHKNREKTTTPAFYALKLTK